MAETKGSIDFEHVGIGTALKRNRLIVPVNQREYSWEKKHVLDLFQDFARAISENKSSYFLGTIVLTAGKSGSFEVADGQQRLATATILLAAIRDYLAISGDDLLVQSIEEFLFTIIRETRETVPRITLNLDDRDFFHKRILSKPKSKDRKIEPKKASHDRIILAAEEAKRHIDNILKPLKKANHVSLLNTWTAFIENSAQVIVLKVPDDLNAFVMFETLNDRGLKTSQSDLLKNYLFGEADDRLNEAQQRWASMIGLLEGTGDDEIVITYLRHVTISLYGYTREREVFEKIKGKVSGKGNAIQFLDVLATNANDYVALMTPSHQKWNNYTPSMRGSLRTLDLLKVVPLRPLMLAIVRKFPQMETERAFRLLITWSVRLLITRGGRSGIVEESYGDAAKKINDGTITSTKQLAVDLAKIIPTDAEFEETFATARVAQNYLVRYYLRALELKHKGTTEPELIPNEDPVINLEHILPENPNENWPNIDPETAEAYWRRIGNMVLLRASKNALIGNSSFADKKSTLRASAFLLTSDVAKNKSWGRQEINDRQRVLAKLAVQTWSVNLP
jgi:hypothetical protein